MVTDACFTGAGRGSEQLLAGGRTFTPAKATVVGRALGWDAVQANEVAGPLESVQHGAFTYFAIGALRGWADGEVSGKADGTVTAEEAQSHVSNALKSAGFRDQSPGLVGETAESRVLASGAVAGGSYLGVGKWTGAVDEPGASTSKYSTNIEFWVTTEGSVAGTVDYPELKCADGVAIVCKNEDDRLLCDYFTLG